MEENAVADIVFYDFIPSLSEIQTISPDKYWMFFFKVIPTSLSSLPCKVILCQVSFVTKYLIKSI